MIWTVYNLYPKGKEKRTEKLNECRLKIEKILQSCVDKYRWFTILYTPDRVKIGIYEGDGNEIIKKIENETKTFYPGIQIEPGSENYYELMAIASEARVTIEERFPTSRWTINDVSLLNHFILNPQGYDFEGNVHIRALLNIKDRVENNNLKEIIDLIYSRVTEENVK